MTLPTAEVETRRLISDLRYFDAKVIRSTLEVYNGIYAYADRTEPNPSISGPFAWLPNVMRRKAEAAFVEPELLSWESRETVESLAAICAVLLFLIGAFRPSLQKSGSISLSGKRSSAKDWINETLQALPIYSRYVNRGHGLELLTVPALRSLETAIAYAVAVLQLNRHGFADLIRPCRYLRDDRPGSLAHHYFLADHGRQQFCSANHANAHRQREFRRAQVKPRKPK